MSIFIVDENVAIVANDPVRSEAKAPQADGVCRLACVRLLRKAAKSGVVAIDAAGEVLQAYRRHLNYRGQPGVGDAFFKHLVDHQFNHKRVRRVALPRHADRGFEAFPADSDLATFDPSDRIYVALALVAPGKPTIFNAVDSDYREHEQALRRVGVKVTELCPRCIRTR
jgi:hypothetical protein